MLVMTATVAECKENFGVGTEMLQPILPEEYEYKVPPQRVWQATADVVGSRTNCQILVRDKDDFILSWIDYLHKTVEGSEKATDNHQSGKTEEFSKSEISEVGEDGIAITTVCIRPRIKGSLMRIRRVYYGSMTQPMMVHSRGVFANFFKELVAQKLGNL